MSALLFFIAMIVPIAVLGLIAHKLIEINNKNSKQRKNKPRKQTKTNTKNVVKKQEQSAASVETSDKKEN